MPTLDRLDTVTHLVALVDSRPRRAWLFDALQKRLREEFDPLQLEVNEEREMTHS